MLNRLAIAGVIYGALGLWLAPSAQAQHRAAYLQNQTPNLATAYHAPTVSPYLNLGVTPGGVSNYQSLVRPLMDEQEALARQAVTLQRLQRQVREARDAKLGGASPGADKPEARSAGRFMFYSHYFPREH